MKISQKIKDMRFTCAEEGLKSEPALEFLKVFMRGGKRIAAWIRVSVRGARIPNRYKGFVSVSEHPTCMVRGPTSMVQDRVHVCL